MIFLCGKFKDILIIQLGLFLMTQVVNADDPPYGGIKLLDGYKYEKSKTIDTINARIFNNEGFTIEFESGISEGYAADPKKRAQYIWFREQDIKGRKVYLAMTTIGIGTNWKPSRWRSPKTGRIMLITFPGRFGPLDAANFFAEVTSDQELADMLLMVLTFDPDK